MAISHLTNRQKGNIMRKSRFCLFAIVAMVLSMSVSASVLDERSYTEPSFVMIAGISVTEKASVNFEYTNDYEMDVISVIEVVPISLAVLKPYKQETKFAHPVIKPVKLAVMQNSNFDRVLVVSYRI